MYGPEGTEPEAVARLGRHEQLEAMEEWFRSKFESPCERTPYEGEWVWTWGGPYDARDELASRYDEYVDEHVIEELAERLSGENFEWAPVESIEDYDPDLVAAIGSMLGTQMAFFDAFESIRELLHDAKGSAHEAVQSRLLYSYVLTALECYLCDTFAREVLESARRMRSFVKTTPEFQKRRISYSEVFDAADDAGEEVAKYLGGIVWHNLSKVSSMYRDTLGIHFGEHLGPLLKCVAIRHDVVHRNGHDKRGARIEIAQGDVEDFAVRSHNLVAHIESQLQGA